MQAPSTSRRRAVVRFCDAAPAPPCECFILQHLGVMSDDGEDRCLLSPPRLEIALDRPHRFLAQNRLERRHVDAAIARATTTNRGDEVALELLIASVLLRGVGEVR